MTELGYNFLNEELLTEALTHASYSSQNYERLEFLGDSILDFLVAEYFFNNISKNEGILTKLRSNFVSEKYLCKIFDKLNLNDKVLLGKSYKGELSDAIKADIVEAVIAAIYLDCSDLNVVRDIVVNLLELANYTNHIERDFKTDLQEYVQSKNKRVSYRLIKKSGESHNPVWTMGVFLDGEKIAEGTSTSKSKAEQIGANHAIELLKGEKNDRNKPLVS